MQLLSDLANSLEVCSVEVVICGRLRGNLFQLILHCTSNSNSKQLKSCNTNTWLPQLNPIYQWHFRVSRDDLPKVVLAINSCYNLVKSLVLNVSVDRLVRKTQQFHLCLTHSFLSQ